MKQHDYSEYTLNELRIALEHTDKTDTARVQALQAELHKREAKEASARKKRDQQRRLQGKLLPPPRAVPLALIPQLYFGGAMGIIGWGVLSFGMIFFWVFAANSEAIPLLRFIGEKQHASGIVQHAEETSASENGHMIIKVQYAFGAHGEVYIGTSYVKDFFPQMGETVPVEYLQEHPEHSRIVGGQMAMFSSWTLLVSIMPLVGLIFVITALRRGRFYHRLLKRGMLGFGTIVSAEPTNVVINDRTQYRYIFAFEAENGDTYEVEARTHLYEKMEDEEEEMILYNSQKPSEALVLDEMPIKPRIGKNGQYALPKGALAKALLVSVLPILSCLGNFLYILTLV